MGFSVHVIIYILFVSKVLAKVSSECLFGISYHDLGIINYALDCGAIIFECIMSRKFDVGSFFIACVYSQRLLKPGA